MPFDKIMQKDILRRAMALLQSAQEPGIVEIAPHQWPGDPDWRLAYAREAKGPEILKIRALLDVDTAEIEGFRLD